mmetsp:Transcript_85663/g.266316  ORF Transcript_85663/g.266316 Transcript_85663/m.266316 type:complete len:234 (+) Transcript_85663:765-1466(+)
MLPGCCAAPLCTSGSNAHAPMGRPWQRAPGGRWSGASAGTGQTAATAASRRLQRRRGGRARAVSANSWTKAPAGAARPGRRVRLGRGPCGTWASWLCVPRGWRSQPGSAPQRLRGAGRSKAVLWGCWRCAGGLPGRRFLLQAMEPKRGFSPRLGTRRRRPTPPSLVQQRSGAPPLRLSPPSRKPRPTSVCLRRASAPGRLRARCVSIARPTAWSSGRNPPFCWWPSLAPGAES